MDVFSEQATLKRQVRLVRETFSHRELGYRQLRDNDTPTSIHEKYTNIFFNN